MFKRIVFIFIFIFNTNTFSFNTHHPINIPMNGKTNLPLKNEKIWCTTCHTEHTSSPAAIPNYLKLSYKNLCMNCHADKGSSDKNHMGMNLYKDSTKMPGITVDSCSSCHSMHFAQQGLTIYLDSTMCTKCHAEKRKQMHKLMPMMAALAASQKIRLENEQLTCQTCHSPHNEKITNHFLKEKKTGLLQFCSTCHGEGTIAMFEGFHKKLNPTKNEKAK